MESLFITTGFALLGWILFWLIAGRYWGKLKAKPYQLGLWWGAWVVYASVLTIGTKYYNDFEEIFFRIILTVPILFGIIFIAGFLFRKLKPISGTLPIVANTSSRTSSTNISIPTAREVPYGVLSVQDQSQTSSPVSTADSRNLRTSTPQAATVVRTTASESLTKTDDAWYEQALEELENGQTAKAVWARSLAEANGDDAKARGTYIRLRVFQLKSAQEAEQAAAAEQAKRAAEAEQELRRLFEADHVVAEQGDARAQNNLGVMYDDGRGVPQDYAQAVKWYRLSAGMTTVGVSRRTVPRRGMWY